VPAHLGFRGLDDDLRDSVIVTGFHAGRTHKLTPGQKEANRFLLAVPAVRVRDAGEGERTLQGSGRPRG
jgi:hypothetical protein